MHLTMRDPSKITWYACPIFHEGVRRDSNPHRPRSQPGVLLQLDYIHQSIQKDLNLRPLSYQDSATNQAELWIEIQDKGLRSLLANNRVTRAEDEVFETPAGYPTLVFKTSLLHLCNLPVYRKPPRYHRVTGQVKWVCSVLCTTGTRSARRAWDSNPVPCNQGPTFPR